MVGDFYTISIGGAWLVNQYANAEEVLSSLR